MPWVETNPIYHLYPIDGYKGNPLIEAINLPAADNNEAIKRLSRKPEFNIAEIDIAPNFRKLLPSNSLTNFMFPTKQHLEIMNFINIQIINGYVNRNPLTPNGQYFLHESKYKSLSSIPGNFPSTITFITGLSGVGKSTLINSILNSMGKPVIQHSNYAGLPFTETQILYLKRNIPDQVSAKALAQSFGIYTDSLLNQSYYSKIFCDKSQTRTQYVSELRKIIINHHVGVIVIDDFQNLSIAHSGGKKELLALILNLREELGVPIIIIGTNKAAELLLDSDRTANTDESLLRRLIENGYHKLERPESPNDKEWQALCTITWKYQWLKHPLDITNNIIEALYDCSQGITGIMLMIFITCQKVAIGQEKESIDENLIKKTYKKYFVPLHDLMNTLRSGNINKYDCAFTPSIGEIQKTLGINTNKTMNDLLSMKVQELNKNLASTKTGNDNQSFIDELNKDSKIINDIIS
ncbi:MAG: AAA family ATPase [Bacteroidia bacterium]